MALSKKIQKEVEGLEQKIETLVKTCDVYRYQTHQLTEELGMSRMEAEKAKKRIEKLEQENAQLKEEMASMMSVSQKQPLVGPINLDEVLEEPDVHRNKRKGFDYCGKDPEGIFPEEVWRMVFDNLKDPKDLKSCYETCPLFQEMLQDTRQIFLLTDVLRIVSSNVPTLRRSSTLKTCRLVCYGWKQCVDKFVHSEFSTFSPEQFQEPSFAPVRFTSRSNPWNNSVLQGVSAGYNPIPSGYLIYSEIGLWSLTQNDLRNPFRSFLNKFGSYVLAIKVEFREDESSSVHSVDCYNFLCECLSMMPNLKVLYLSLPISKRCDEYSSEEDYGHGDDDDEDYPFHRDIYGYRCGPKRWSKLKKLKAGVGMQSCPDISNLKIIYFEKCPSIVIHAVLTANPQVEKMMIKKNFGKDGDFYSLKLDMLQEVSLIEPRCLNHTAWKLQRLTLNRDKWTVDFDKLSEILEEDFCDSLEELTLTVNEEDDTRQYGGYRLRLPKLKKLNLRRFGRKKSLDFILLMENLEELIVDLVGNGSQKKAENEAEGIIQLENYISRLKYSNIWELLPKLKKVRARDRSDPEKNSGWKFCTRSEACA